MSDIPVFNDGTLMKDVREKTINPMVNLVNEMDVENGEQNTAILNNRNMLDAVKAIAEGNTSVLAMLTEDIVDKGAKCRAEHRIYTYTASTSELSIPIELEDTEFAVRAVIRTGSMKGEFTPVSKMSYDRTTKVLTVTVGTHRTGQVFIEYWKMM